jgi:predicted O-linked N-acetylglucosamine transferase (SPINDLY family)
MMLFPHSYFPTDLRQSGGSTELDTQSRVATMRRIGLPEDVPLLSGFNQLWKINAPLFRSWLEILNVTGPTESHLWLLKFPEVAIPQERPVP